MLELELYANEKLREIESGRMVCAQTVAPPPGKPALAPLARPLGRAMHRFGHRLESWATPSPQAEASDLGVRGRTG